MAECSLFPCVVWKIKGVSKYCKRKSPNFTFRNTQWKLKFLYAKKIDGGDICQVFLKRSGNQSASKNLRVNSWCTSDKYATENFRKSVTLTTELNEWLIWECKNSDLYQTIRNISHLWDKYFFVCVITPDKWMSPKLVPGKGKTEPSLLENNHCITSLCHDFGKLFNSQVMSDVILICGDQKIYAHRNILAARSDVFAAMFRIETNESTERAVNITDIESDVLDILVRYMYTGKAPNLTHTNVRKVYAAAEKYGIESLKMKCGMFMVENTAVTNVSPANFEIAESGDCTLKENVFSHFVNIKAVLSTEEWKKLSEVEPKFAYEAFIFFLSKSPSL